MLGSEDYFESKYLRTNRKVNKKLTKCTECSECTEKFRRPDAICHRVLTL